MLDVPAHLLSVRYDAARYPGALDTADIADLTGGANCQLFAYALLLHFGRSGGTLRPSDLWEDVRYIRRVTAPDPSTCSSGTAPQTRGAHVGVYLGDGRAVHLSKEVGVPAVWPLRVFSTYPRPRVFVGAKRVVRGG